MEEIIDQSYIEIRQHRSSNSNNLNQNRDSSFPNTWHQTHPVQTGIGYNSTNNFHNNGSTSTSTSNNNNLQPKNNYLFSVEELKNLTLDLIKKPLVIVKTGQINSL